MSVPSVLMNPRTLQSAKIHSLLTSRNSTTPEFSRYSLRATKFSREKAIHTVSHRFSFHRRFTYSPREIVKSRAFPRILAISVLRRRSYQTLHSPFSDNGRPRHSSDFIASQSAKVDALMKTVPVVDLPTDFVRMYFNA